MKRKAIANPKSARGLMDRATDAAALFGKYQNANLAERIAFAAGWVRGYRAAKADAEQTAPAKKGTE